MLIWYIISFIFVRGYKVKHYCRNKMARLLHILSYMLQQHPNLSHKTQKLIHPQTKMIRKNKQQCLFLPNFAPTSNLMKQYGKNMALVRQEG